MGSGGSVTLGENRDIFLMFLDPRNRYLLVKSPGICQEAGKRMPRGLVFIIGDALLWGEGSSHVTNEA